MCRSRSRPRRVEKESAHHLHRRRMTWHDDIPCASVSRRHLFTRTHTKLCDASVFVRRRGATSNDWGLDLRGPKSRTVGRKSLVSRFLVLLFIGHLCLRVFRSLTFSVVSWGLERHSKTNLKLETRKNKSTSFVPSFIYFSTSKKSTLDLRYIVF